MYTHTAKKIKVVLFSVFHALLSFKSSFFFILETCADRGLSTKIALLLLQNCTGHVEKFWDKGANRIKYDWDNIISSFANVVFKPYNKIQAEYRVNYCRADFNLKIKRMSSGKVSECFLKTVVKKLGKSRTWPANVTYFYDVNYIFFYF